MAARPGTNGFIKRLQAHGERTSIISASQQGKLVAPLVFQGSCNSEVGDTYFEKVLLPALPPGSVIVLDNARFHQSPTTQKLVDAAGCQLLFLPSYSPDLNPIEHLWAAFKTVGAKTSPPPATPSFLSPICAYIIVNFYITSIYNFDFVPVKIFCPKKITSAAAA
jgi:transposase